MAAILSNTGGASFNRDQGAAAGVGQDYKRLKSDYDRAYRILRRQRDDPNAAVGMVNLRKQAESEGISLGGRRSAEGMGRDVAARTSSLERRVSDEEKKVAMNRGLGGGDPTRIGTDVLGDGSPMNVGAKLPEAPMSFDEQERVGRERSAASGAFGRRAQMQSVTPPAMQKVVPASSDAMNPSENSLNPLKKPMGTLGSKIAAARKWWERR